MEYENNARWKMTSNHGLGMMEIRKSPIVHTRSVRVVRTTIHVGRYDASTVERASMQSRGKEITEALKTRGVKAILQSQKEWAKAFGHKLGPREWSKLKSSIRGVATCRTCGSEFVVDIFQTSENVGEFAPHERCSETKRKIRCPKTDWSPPPKVTVTYCRHCGAPTHAGLGLVDSNCTDCGKDGYLGFATYVLDVSTPRKATNNND